MGEDTHAAPMTLFTPVPWWRVLLLRPTWALTRFVLRFNSQAYPFGSLRKLAFIHFAHWSLVDRIPASSHAGRKLRPRYILFQTNFNRGWQEYVEAFCYVVPTAMRLNWRGAYDFPPPHPVGPFLDFVDKRFTKEAHFYCAYPDASVRMVLAATHARRKFNRFAADTSEPPPRFRRRGSSDRVPGVVLLGTQKAHTISVFTPLLPGCAESLRAKLKALPKDEGSPLARVAGTHMARWSIVDPLPDKHGNPIDATSYLLFTSWFSGEVSCYVETLGDRLGPFADEIWGNCSGYPGVRDREAFVSYMLEYSIKPRLQFAGYKQPVTDIRASLELEHRLREPVVTESRMDSQALEQEWLHRHQG